jgi:hypothetical protein
MLCKPTLCFLLQRRSRRLKAQRKCWVIELSFLTEFGVSENRRKSEFPELTLRHGFLFGTDRNVSLLVP